MSNKERLRQLEDEYLNLARNGSITPKEHYRFIKGLREVVKSAYKNRYPELSDKEINKLFIQETTAEGLDYE